MYRQAPARKHATWGSVGQGAGTHRRCCRAASGRKGSGFTMQASPKASSLSQPGGEEGARQGTHDMGSGQAGRGKAGRRAEAAGAAAEGWRLGPVPRRPDHPEPQRASRNAEAHTSEGEQRQLGQVCDDVGHAAERAVGQAQLQQAARRAQRRQRTLLVCRSR